MGRPTDYTPELADEICARVIESDYGLEQICQEDDMPCARSVFRWLAKYPDFSQQYARAKEQQGHVQADRATRDALQAEDPQLGRLRYDARKWQASKLAAKVYGDKITQEHTGPNGGPIETRDVSELASLPREKRQAIREALQGALGNVSER